MKIAMLGHKRIPSREGGVEIVVEELATRMAAMGHAVTVYNRKGKHVGTGNTVQKNNAGKSSYKGVQIITVPTFEKKSLNAIVYAVLATFRAVFGHYDVIHFHAEGSCAMLWLPHLFKIRTVATIHGLDWQRAKWGGFATRFLLHGEKNAVKYADEIIVLSENVKQYFKDTYHRETVFIPNGISRPQIEEASLITEKYGLTKDSYFLFLARLVPEKGAHYLIEAYKKLQQKMGDKLTKKLVIAGGASHSSDYVKELKELIGEDIQIICTGFVEGQELAELYSNAYVYVLPSDVEGMPVSLLEAMSYGNCCLVSDIPENKEVAVDKALTFQKGNVEDLQINLQRLLEEDALTVKYKKQAADFICEKYKWTDIVEKTLHLYKGHIAKKK